MSLHRTPIERCFGHHLLAVGLFVVGTAIAGTTQVAATAPGVVGSKVIIARFDANVTPGLTWRFLAPGLVEVRLGEERLVAFTTTNIRNEPLLGTATYNVTPRSALEEYLRTHHAAVKATGAVGAAER